MKDYKVLLTCEAIHDIADIAEYIELHFGSIYADQFQENLKKEVSKLGYMGGVFFNTQIYYQGYAIHKKPFPPSGIFYILNESTREVHVLRILRDQCNWKRILNRSHFTFPG